MQRVSLFERKEFSVRVGGGQNPSPRAGATQAIGAAVGIIRQENVRRKHRGESFAICQTLGQFACAVQGVGPAFAQTCIAAQGEADLASEVAQFISGLAQVASASICVQRA